MIDLLDTADVAIAIDSYPQHRGAKEEDKVNPTRSEGGGEADDRTQGGVITFLVAA